MRGPNPFYVGLLYAAILLLGYAALVGALFGPFIHHQH